MILTAFVLLLVLLAIALPVAATLGIMGLTLDALYSNLPLSRALAEVGWTSSNGFVLLSVPLFVMLGEVLLRSGLADKMYDSMTAWLGWLPGGLMHSNVGASALFAATCGSSAATAATIATVALPQATAYRSLGTGALCAVQLAPPSRVRRSKAPLPTAQPWYGAAAAKHKPSTLPVTCHGSPLPVPSDAAIPKFRVLARDGHAPLSLQPDPWASDQTAP